ncbi:hypothetical protein THAOC_25333 [Thalassiosira oceanica]|uniref:Uncharacterized protein n=1 Tax=Thalassiosira oceanica TaxID=159749 RepID=K0S1Q1_THAOC|nr:hypothetical protein THAOC_25333 [Thalassiosira oceanica]|eukprot:EJK54986.1 hypothetical protein THAOC_25333 [Thalassiosira oceanica]
MLTYRAEKQRIEDNNDTSSEHYHNTCLGLEEAKERIGADWDGVTVLEDKIDKQTVMMPDYIIKAIGKGDIKTVLKWINANPTEDRVNAISNAETMATPALSLASIGNHLGLMTLLLQLGANVGGTTSFGSTPLSAALNCSNGAGNLNERERLLLSWGTGFSPYSREECVFLARKYCKNKVADLLETELGGRRCEIVNLSTRPELNGKTCVADEYLPDINQYKVTLETKSREVLVLGADNLNRRDRTPQDCGYYMEFKNGRTIRHDFDSSEDCQAFVGALNSRDEKQPIVTEEAEAAAEQAAAELLAELGLDNPTDEVPISDDAVKKSKKKKGGKAKKKKRK